jgi:hypothetical protein
MWVGGSHTHTHPHIRDPHTHETHTHTYETHTHTHPPTSERPTVALVQVLGRRIVSAKRAQLLVEQMMAVLARA